MSTELLYTSAPQGLRHGSRGFCTVLTTAGMPINVIAQLEAISSYRRLFKAGTDRDSENPIAYAHQRVNLGGQVVSVISRVAAYGLDYSGRDNKIAHHVTVNVNEMPAAGPAWLLQQRSVLRSEWLGQCETPASGPAIPRGDQPPRICTAWKSIAGDAGWGGVVAEAIAAGGAAPLWVIYPLEHQHSLLELMDEAISLLPPAQRWRATFNTFAANIPPGVECKIRFVPDAAEEARFARSDGKAIDLTKQQSITSASVWVERARGVVRPEAAPATTGSEFNALEGQDIEGPPIESDWTSSEDPPATPPPPTGPPELPPELTSGKQTRKKLIAAAVVIAVIAGIGSTWAVARMMAGLPLMPGAEPPAPPVVPHYTPESEPEVQPVAPKRERAATQQHDLRLHYDKQQILAWAQQSPELDSDFPSTVSLRGFVRIMPIEYLSSDTSGSDTSGSDTSGSGETENSAEDSDSSAQDSEASDPETPARVKGTHGIENSHSISWGGETVALDDPKDLRVASPRLTGGAQTLSVRQFPEIPDSLGKTQVYCSPETGDLIGIADLNWNETPEFLSEQADGYRRYVVMLSQVKTRLESIERESKSLPELFQDAVELFLRSTFPGKADSRLETMIRKGGRLDLAEEATKLSDSLLMKSDRTTRSLNKEEEKSLLHVVSDCERISLAASELRRAHAVLEKGQTIEVPDLRFYETESNVLRRIPIRIHFSW